MRAAAAPGSGPARGWLARLALACLFSLAAGCGARNLPAADPRPAYVQAIPGYTNEVLHDEVFGAEVHVVRAGPAEAPTVLLVHGLGDRGLADWFPILAGLAAHLRVVAVDLPGFGLSTHAAELYSPERYVEFLRRTLRPRLPARFHLVGHSMGATLSLAYAAAWPDDLEQLALLDAAGILHRESYAAFTVLAGLGPIPGMLPGAGRVARTLSSVLTSPVTDTLPDPAVLLQSEAARRAVLRSPGRIAALALILEDFGPHIAAVRAPTLLLWGASDTVAPLRTARLLQARISDATLRVLPGSAHEPVRSEPDAVLALLLEHLQPRSGSPAPSRSEHPDAPIVAGTTAVCERGASMVFEGAYELVRIERCTGAVLRGVRARRVEIADSDVAIEGGRFESDGTALTIRGSRVELTGADIHAQVGIEASGSELDLAGVHLMTRKAALKAEQPVRAVFSVSRVQSDRTRGYVHGTRHLGSGAQL